MQAIITEFKGPTNTKGSRVAAKCWIKNKTVDWNHALNSEENHKTAAEKLVDIINQERIDDVYQWRIIAVGALPGGKGNAYVIDLFKAEN